MLRSIRRVLMGLMVVLCLAMPATADDVARLKEIDAISTLSNTSNEDALQQLRALKAVLPADASHAVRKELLLLQIRLLFDAGRLDQAYAVNEELLRLAQAKGDAAGIALARLGDVDRLLDKNQAEQALARVRQLKKEFPAMPGADVQAQLNLRLGRIYNALAKYEEALTHFLAALKHADAMTRGAADVRLAALQHTSRLYINAKAPEKALATARAALAMAEGAQGKTRANLFNTEGSALIALGRFEEGLQSFQHALEVAREGRLDTLAAKVLGKMADVHLRQHDYLAAEKVAREALLTAQKIEERNSVLMAKANIGFALGGQGKVTQARPLVNEVIDEFRKAESPRNLESMLDEASRMYERNGLHKEALALTREQQKLRVKLFDVDRARAVAALQEAFDANNRTRQIELLARGNQLKDADIRNRRLQQAVTLLGAALTVVTGGVIYLLYRRVRKANRKLQQLNTQLEFHATRDPLTGLYNRRSFVERMKARAMPAARNRRTEQPDDVDCITLMDIDNFKNINDTLGHAAGDQVLVEIAARLNHSVRDSDMVLRWGGEEFLVFSSRASPDQLVPMVKRMLDGIGSEPVKVDGAAVSVTVSAGFIALPFSGIPESELDWEKAVQLADLGLYLGKLHGRNRAVGLARLLAPMAEAMPAMQADLAKAARNGLVELVEVTGPTQAK